MKNIFQQVQESFMELGVILSAYNLENELDFDEINEISAALYETNKLFEEGLCERAYICEKCTHNKEQLHTLLQMMQSCARTGKIDRVSKIALLEFMYIVPQVLAELKSVYLSSLQKRKL